MQCGAAAGRAGNPHVPADCFYAIDQADEPRPIAAVGATDAVVANREHQRRPIEGDVDIHLRGVRMPGGVREGLGHNVVRRDFGRLRYRPLQFQVQRDRNGAAAGEHLERRTEAAFGRDRWMDAPRQLLEIG